MHNQSGTSQLLQVDTGGIPEPLKAQPQWVCWKLQWKDGKGKKVPINPKTGRFGSATSLSTWGTFDQAWEYYQNRKGDGIDGLGFVFTEDDPYVGIDLDKCRNPETGEFNAFARGIMERMNSYTEISPSGAGVHIFVEGKLPGKGINLGNIEMYNAKRYFTVTGQVLPEFSSVIEDRDEVLKALYYEVTEKDREVHEPITGDSLAPMDVELMARGTAKYGPRFQTLWGGGQDEGETPSQGDLGLCTMISVLTRRNTNEIDRLFRLSGRMREKWDEEHYSDGRTYGQGTIEKAITGPLEAIEKQKDRSTVETTNISLSRDTDVGNGKRLVATHGKDLRYCHQMKTWLIWTGKRWLVDTNQKIMQYAKDTAAAIWQEVAAESEESRRRELVKHAKGSESHSKLKAMVACAQSEEEVAITPDDLDQDPWLLNCLNGTLDLRTGELRRHRRGDLITKIALVKFNPKTECPVWIKFLRKIMGDNVALISFLKRAIGYSLTGITREQVMFILWGIGKNGKTTLLEVLKELLGKDLARQAASETFMQKARAGHIPNDLAALKGARLVTAPELEKGQHLSEPLIKLATGEDEIVARFLYGEYFSYKPQFKLWMMANHKPIIRGTDDGIWRRPVLIPFKVQIPESDRDRQLIDKLKTELPGILNWALQGCLEWQRDGLGIPQEVQDAVAEYRKEMDILGGFLEDRCILNPKAVTPAATIYEAYTLWAEANGETNPLKQGAFGKALSVRGVDRKHLNSGWVRTGITLRPDDAVSN